MSIWYLDNSCATMAVGRPAARFVSKRVRTFHEATFSIWAPGCLELDGKNGPGWGWTSPHSKSSARLMAAILHASVFNFCLCRRLAYCFLQKGCLILPECRLHMILLTRLLQWVYLCARRKMCTRGLTYRKQNMQSLMHWRAMMTCLTLVGHWRLDPYTQSPTSEPNRL